MSLRRGYIKVMNGRKRTLIQEELNGSVKMYSQEQWLLETEKRQAMTDEEWNEYSGAPESEENDTGVVAGAKKGKKSASKKVGAKKGKSAQRPVVKGKKDATLIQDDDENDPEEIKR